jgi:hypothetical protein
MAQIFSPRVGLYAKLVLLALLALITAIVLAWRGLTAAAYAIDAPVQQPVPFSHKHHVGDDGIDCRYCHSSVETEATAGIPPISTCMTCHSQLYTDQHALAPVVDSWESAVALHWQRVHDLPDFAFFDHSIHVAKGVGCVECHGRVDKMPLTARVAPLSMAWCLDCHRDPAPHLRPLDKVFAMDWRAPDQEALGSELLSDYHIATRKLTECSICHR